MNTKKSQLALINEAFMELRRILDSTRYSDRYYNLCEQEERDHRRFAPYGTKFGLTVKQAAQLFYIRNIIRYLSEDPDINRQPKAEQYFIFKQSIFAGYATFKCVDETQFNSYFSKSIVKALMDLDYSELVH